MLATAITALENRTRAFAISAVKLHRLLLSSPEFWDIARQLNRAANSVAANHRAMSRARSMREFAATLHTVHEEADEAAHWLGILRDCDPKPQVAPSIGQLLSEAEQLRNYFGRARATTRRRHFSS